MNIIDRPKEVFSIWSKTRFGIWEMKNLIQPTNPTNKFFDTFNFLFAIGIGHSTLTTSLASFRIMPYINSGTLATVLMVKNIVFVCLFVCLFLLVYWQSIIKIISTLFNSVQEKQLNLEDLLYDVDDEGSTLLHLAVDSGNLQVGPHNLWV